MPFTNFDNEDNIEVVIQFKESLLVDQLAKFPEFKRISEICQLSHTGLLFAHHTKKELSNQLIGLVDLPKPLQLCRLFEVLYTLGSSDERTNMNVSGMVSGGKPSDYNRVNKVYDYVAANYKSDIRISEVAEIVGLTTNSFCRFFKKVNQKSFVQFVNEYRINKAIEMMNLKQGSISETMYESGFNDPSFFNRQFKKSRGMSPSEYRKVLQTV